jgi:hypothetical protein
MTHHCPKKFDSLTQRLKVTVHRTEKQPNDVIVARSPLRSTHDLGIWIVHDRHTRLKWTEGRDCVLWYVTNTCTGHVQYHLRLRLQFLISQIVGQGGQLVLELVLVLVLVLGQMYMQMQMYTQMQMYGHTHVLLELGTFIVVMVMVPPDKSK